jgi:outer membrane PBP1 activator LpoA protein
MRSLTIILLKYLISAIIPFMAKHKSFFLALFIACGLFCTSGSAQSAPHNIVLLVPLSGNLAESGQAIQNGFLTAYYYTQQYSKTDATVNLVDAAKGNLLSLYQQAVSDGADFIVGPLTKNDVGTLAKKSSLPVTTLALNTIDNYQNKVVNNLYQFGLSAQDEALQVADKAWHDHPGRALIITPDSEWGNNLLGIIKNRWQSLGGSVIATLTYNDNNLMQQIQHVLNVDLSQNTGKSLQTGLNEKVNFIPHRRQDVDVILLVGFPQEARQIKPLLNFYYAGDLPVYATSAIYSGIAQPNLDRDMDGIIFCDLPWALNNNLSPSLQAIKDQVIKTWPDSYNANSKLYALGVDAFFMALNFNQLLDKPEAGVSGATGTLMLDKYNHIYRKLDWAQIKNGTPVILANDNF